jgi:hypothetical protein
MKAREYFESRNVIKADPALAMYRTQLFVAFFFFVAVLALLTVSIAIDVTFHGGRHFFHGTALFSHVFILVSLAILLMLSISQVRYWGRIERRRFAAIRGNQHFLAAEQTAPDTASLPLPVTITLRPYKGAIFLTTGIALLLILLLCGSLTLPDSYPLRLFPGPLLNFLVFFAIVVVFTLVISFAMQLSPLVRQQITVTEGGLASTNGKKVTTVPWHEARLFALYVTFGAQKSGAAVTYELSSARDIVRWTWIWRKTYWVGLEPVIPHDEYNQQMQALLSFVVARTGLPLYDLREDLPGGGPKD